MPGCRGTHLTASDKYGRYLGAMFCPSSFDWAWRSASNAGALDCRRGCHSAAAEVGESFPQRCVDLIANLDFNDLAGPSALVQSFEKRMITKLRFRQCSSIWGRRRQAVSHGGPRSLHSTSKCMSFVARLTMQARSGCVVSIEGDDDYQARSFSVSIELCR